MKRVLKCLVAAALMLSLLLTATAALAETVYGKCTADGVKVRRQPGTDASIWFSIDRDFVCEILGEVTEDGEMWYKVNSTHPEPNGHTYVGYVHSDYFRPLSEEETRDYLESAGGGNEPTLRPSADSALTGSIAEYADIIGPAVENARGRVTSNNVNLRSEPSTKGEKLGVMMMGDEVELLTIPPRKGSSYWYCVRVDEQVGYIQSSYIYVIDAGTLAPTPTIDPGAEEDDPTPTVKPAATPTVKPGTLPVIGTGSITASGVNFRLTPSTDGEKIGKMNAGTVVELLEIPEEIGTDYWYRVRYNGQEGYIQSNYVRVLTTQNTPTPAPSYYGYAMLDCSTGNLRDKPNGKTVAQWSGYGTLLPIAGDAEEASGSSYLWYPVYYGADNKIYYVREDIIKVVNTTDSDATPTPEQTSRYGYVRITEAGTNLRIKPFGESIAQIRLNVVLTCMAAPERPEGTEYDWFFVEYNGMLGYVRGDCVQVCNADGSDIEVPTPPPSETVPVEPGSRGYIRMTANQVNIRVAPGGTSLGMLKEGQILPIVGDAIKVGKYEWYCVRTADGIVGYVRDDMFIECDAQGNKVTPAPTATPSPTPSPSDGPILSSYGYVQITGGSVNLRKTPNGTVLTTVKKGTVWPMVGVAKKVDGDTWYPIQAGSDAGYVSGTVSFKLSKEQEAAYLAGLGVPVETPDPGTVESNYVIVTGNSVNLRESASLDSAAPYQVKKGTVIPFIGKKPVGTKTWFNVVYEGRELWIRGDYARVMTQAEYNEWLGDAGVEEPKQLGWVRFNTNGVYVRNAAAGSVIVDQLNKGTVVAYYKEGIPADGGYWYQIKTPKGEMGYSSAKYLEKCQEDGSDLPVVTPEPGKPSGGNSQQETSYSTLKKGSSGLKVKNLVTELKNQGYYTGAITDQYTSAVVEAVKAFQKAKGLAVDGVAGSSTQHKLFGTVPIGQGSSSDLSFVIYPVEKIDWYTGGIQQMLPRGANFKIYDVKTGIVWWAHRWAGSRHADIETLTRADSERLCQIYGVDNLQEIVDKNLWHRRPSLVTIGTRTFACSVDGMQHNPDGDTIPDNGMDGQICLHFTNSEGHGTGVVSTSHTAAIKEAYEWAKKYYGAK